MHNTQKISLFLTRVSLGWLMFYAGITKILNPEWTSVGYLSNAKTFPNLFLWLASQNNIGWVNILNKWGLTLLGISLILGIAVKLSSIFGIILMILYYLPVLTFPIIGKNSYIVDDHIIFVMVFLVLIAFQAGRIWGFDKFLNKNPKLKLFT